MVQSGDCFDDMARPIYPTISTGRGISTGDVWGLFGVWDILTVSANQERDEEPCSRTEQMECVH